MVQFSDRTVVGDRAVVGGHFALVRRLISALKCLRGDLPDSLQLAVPDIKGSTNSSSSGNGGKNGGKTGGAAPTVTPVLSMAFTFFVTLIHVLI